MEYWMENVPISSKQSKMVSNGANAAKWSKRSKLSDMVGNIPK